MLESTAACAWLWQEVERFPYMDLQLMPTRYCQPLTIIAEGQEAFQGNLGTGCQAHAIVLATTSTPAATIRLTCASRSSMRCSASSSFAAALDMLGSALRLLTCGAFFCHAATRICFLPSYTLDNELRMESLKSITQKGKHVHSSAKSNPGAQKGL